MTPIIGEDVRRIIRGFSRLERELFIGMGGVIPASVKAQPEPEWHHPGSPLPVQPPQTVRMNRATVVKKPKRVRVKKVIVMAAGDVKIKRKVA